MSSSVESSSSSSSQAFIKEHHGNNSSPVGSMSRPRRDHDQKRRPVQNTLTKASFQMPHPSTICSLDCEMVGVGQFGQTSAVARVTLVGWNGEKLLDSYVIQSKPVTDYRTFVSGITKEDLDNAVMTLDQVRQLVSRLLYNRILVGHALKNDLEALNISHPWWLTRDTATYLPFMKKRPNNAAWWPRKLKELAKEKLDREIQAYGRPHSSIEDAIAAIDLYKTVQTKWEGEIYESLVNTNKYRQQKYEAEHFAMLQHQQQEMYNHLKYQKYYNLRQYNNHHQSLGPDRRYYYTQRQQIVQ